MNTTPQKPSAPTVNYGLIVNALNTKGVSLTPDEAKRLEEICEEERKKANLNNDLLGYSLGTDFTSWIYMLFAMVQGFISGKGDFSLAGMGDRFSNAADGAAEKGKLKKLSDACANINMRLSAEGGNLALAAPLVSGTATGNQQVVDMENSFWRQNRSASDLPTGAPVALNPGERDRFPVAPASAADNPTPGNTAAANAANPSLTSAPCPRK